MSRLYKLIALMLLVSSSVFAQYTISGKVTSAQTGENLIGANVILKGTNVGAATDANGEYTITADADKYTVVCSFIGFEKQEVPINLTNNMVLDFALTDFEFSLNVTVIADRAKERETPVAYTQVDKKEMETALGSRDIPMVLNTTPSVYATMTGGGAGDARINIRGFNQNNIAIMINGVPVNDMENGWVYWSNWDGVGDATSSIEIQRGLSAVNLAVASIGGTMNIVTDPTSQQFGVKFKQEFGTGTFLKSTLQASSGLLDGKWAFNTTLVRKTGDNYQNIDKAWTDAYAYYFGAAYNINPNNRLELYAVGAPQRHGQRRYAQNIGTFSKSFALSLPGYDPAAADKFWEDESGINYNENWSPVTVDYNSQEYFNGGLHDRYATDFNNESENYYHKPVVNLNWYSLLSDQLSLYTTVYYSGGVGGSKGTYGSMRWDYNSHSTRVVDWDATITRNQGVADGKSYGIMRNSVNEQWTIGAITKLNFKVSENLNTSFGLDWRTASVDHFREVRDLLGGTYYLDSSNEFDTTTDMKKKVLGDKINYNNTNSIDWLGGYGQAEFTSGPLSVFGMFGYSMVKYTYTDHFKLADDGVSELKLDPDAKSGWQAKGGISYRLSDLVDIYTNFGYVKKVPIFDAVIDDVTATMASDDPVNEKYMAGEFGLNYKSQDRTFAFKANYYYTVWKDRAYNDRVINPDGTEDFVFISGMNSIHRGLELAATYFPLKQVKFDAAISFGNWTYTDNVQGLYKDYSSGTGVETTYNYFVKDLKVGDAPQTQASFSLTLFPIKGMQAVLVMSTYRDYYAGWDPFSRTDPTDTKESWRVPAYTLYDFHFNYELPFDVKGVTLSLFAHVFNLFDEMYISDATDNSSYNAYTGNGKNHGPDDAEVFFGAERNFNFGFSINY